MKKLLLAFGPLALLASCSDDTNEHTTAVVELPAVKLATEVDFYNYEDFSYTLSYNEAHQLESAISDNNVTSYELSYQNGNISNVTGFHDNQDFNVDFSYSPDGIISGVTTGGIDLYVTYNVETRVYTLKSSPLSQSKTEYKLNEDGDLKEIRGYSDDDHSDGGRTFFYESDKKGPLYNSNRVTLQLAIACSENAIFSSTFGAYRPFKHYGSAHGGFINLEGEYDTQDFVLDSKKHGTIAFASFFYSGE